MKYTDDTIMPFGKYKGKELVNVPGSYLLWLNERGISNTKLQEYVDENYDVLIKEQKEEQNKFVR